MSSLCIDLKNVAKTYRGKVQALRGIEMHVRPGEIFGLLGPNGAGKSTLVKILMTVVRPTHAEGTMLGRPLGDKATLARVGYLPEHNRFPEYLTGAQVLDYFGALAGTSRANRRARAGELLELVGMKEWAKKRIRTYSKGMRQRIGIAQALINSPELVLLDEPTDGVDPVGRRDIRNVLVELKSRGKTVFLNSHLLSELEMVCDRVAILVQGLVSSQGTIDELTVEQRRYHVEIEAENAARAEEAYRAALPGVFGADGEGRFGELRLSLKGPNLVIGTADAPPIQPILDSLRRAGVAIRAVRPHRPSLEDLFMAAVTDPVSGKVLEPGAAPRP